MTGELQSVKVGRATVSWGPRTYGPNKVIANAPVDAIDDLVAAIAGARQAIRGIEPCPGAGQPPSQVTRAAQHYFGHAARGICASCGNEYALRDLGGVVRQHAIKGGRPDA